MTRNRLQIDAKVCMYALTVSTIKPKNIKEAMLDVRWIESMQDELNQFKRLDVWELVEYSRLCETRYIDLRIRSVTVSNKLLKPGSFKHPEESVYVICICQSQYTLDLLKKHGMEKCDTVYTPMATTKLDANLQGTQVNQTKYRSMIGGLMYLTASRPDIASATFVCARYQAHLTEKHLKEVKRIFRYLRQTINMGLWYLKDSGFELIAYSDADLVGCNVDCKSTSGGIQFLGDKLVSWSSKKQDCTAMSTTKAEYVSLSACCAQVIWMRMQLPDYGFRYNKILIYCDSQSEIAISCNTVTTFTYKKHI
ncbi:hypothetical protein Tco_0454261 [Tanacetum coccineum]